MRESIVGIDRRGPSRTKLRLNRNSTDERRVERKTHDVADFVIIDPERGGHRQRREDAGVAEPSDGVFLDSPQISAAMRAMRLESKAVELQIHFDPPIVFLEELEKLVVFREPNAVAVHQHANDVARQNALDDPLEV